MDPKQALEKLEKGKQLFSASSRILHTTPHHDDIMLSYFPLLFQMKNYPQRVLCVTSGANSVRKEFVEELLAKEAPSEKSYEDLLKDFSVSYQRREEEKLKEFPFSLLQKKVSKEANPSLDLIKTLVRETEEDRLWSLVSLPVSHVVHMRSQFYRNWEKVEEDIEAMAEELIRFSPDFITVAMDPFETGPETHHKVLQVIAHALRKVLHFDPKILGYRNVWSRFSLEEATHYFPVKKSDFLEQEKAFYHCYPSQYDAMYPSSECAGPFSELAEKIQKEHKENLASLLGKEAFTKSFPDVEGIILLKEMDKEAFLQYAEEMERRHPWKVGKA